MSQQFLGISADYSIDLWDMTGRVVFFFILGMSWGRYSPVSWNVAGKPVQNSWICDWHVWFAEGLTIQTCGLYHIIKKHTKKTGEMELMERHWGYYRESMTRFWRHVGTCGVMWVEPWTIGAFTCFYHVWQSTRRAKKGKRRGWSHHSEGRKNLARMGLGI